MMPCAPQPVLGRRETAVVESPLFAERARDLGESERVAVLLLLPVERCARSLLTPYARPPARARHDCRTLPFVAVNAEVITFKLAQRVCKLRAVGLLAAVERSVTA